MSDQTLPCLVAAAAMMALPQLAQAERIHETGKIGLGIGGGPPLGAGMSGKWFMNEKNALQGLVGIRKGGALLLSPDYLYTFEPIFQDDDVTFGWYGGFGASLSLGSTDFTLGVSAILGVDFCIDRAPIDLYAELRPLLEMAPMAEMHVGSFAGGLRYYF